MAKKTRLCGGLLLFALAPVPFPSGTLDTPVAPAATVEKGDFRFSCDERGLFGLAHPRDPFGATLMPASAAGRGGQGPGGKPGRPPVLGLVVRYRPSGSGDWVDLARGPKWEARPAAGTVTYASGGPDVPLSVVETFRTDGRVLDWTIALKTTGPSPVEVGDLGIDFPVVGPMGENPAQIFERGFLRHQFVSGHGSFFYFIRASGAPPYLLVTVLPGTKLEYTAGGGGRGGARVFVHSARTGRAETRGTWRQDHTALDLAPAGRPGSRADYGFRMQWAGSYEELLAQSRWSWFWLPRASGWGARTV